MSDLWLSLMKGKTNQIFEHAVIIKALLWNLALKLKLQYQMAILHRIPTCGYLGSLWPVLLDVMFEGKGSWPNTINLLYELQ